MNELYKRLSIVDAERKELKERLKDLDQEHADLALEITEAWNESDEKIERISLKDIGCIHRHEIKVFSVDNHELLHSSLRASGHASLIKESVHNGTLKSHFQGQIDDGLITEEQLTNFGVKKFIKHDIRIKR